MNGKEVEPTGPVNVSIKMKDVQAQENEDVQVIHFQEEGETEVLNSKDVEVLNPQDSQGEGKSEARDDGAKDTGLTGEDVSGVSFTTDGFSVYGIAYTVDFHWEVNGKTYEFSIPGGGFVSLEHLVEVLGIASADENTENGAENTENGTVYDEAIKLNEVEVSKAAKTFVADVESVEFSSPELVWAGKVDEATTVGGLKEANGLQVEYSAELTEEQIAEINRSTVEAGDWALISVQPFTTEETLTVTMKNGEQWTVKVTEMAALPEMLVRGVRRSWEMERSRLARSDSWREFSIEDKYGKYRRILKKEAMNKE